MSERNFNISATILNSAFIPAVAGRRWALPFLRMGSQIPAWARFALVLFAVLCSACPPTNGKRRALWPGAFPAGCVLLSASQGVASCLCTPKPDTCRLFPGRGQLTWLLCWSYTPLARTPFALVSGSLPFHLFPDFLALLVLSPFGIHWFFTAGRPHVSSESWGHACSSLQSLLHSTSVFSVV